MYIPSLHMIQMTLPSTCLSFLTFLGINLFAGFFNSPCRRHFVSVILTAFLFFYWSSTLFFNKMRKKWRKILSLYWHMIASRIKSHVITWFVFCFMFSFGNFPHWVCFLSYNELYIAYEHTTLGNKILVRVRAHNYFGNMCLCSSDQTFSLMQFENRESVLIHSFLLRELYSFLLALPQSSIFII